MHMRSLNRWDMKELLKILWHRLKAPMDKMAEMASQHMKSHRELLEIYIKMNMTGWALFKALMDKTVHLVSQHMKSHRELLEMSIKVSLIGLPLFKALKVFKGLRGILVTPDLRAPKAIPVILEHKDPLVILALGMVLLMNLKLLVHILQQPFILFILQLNKPGLVDLTPILIIFLILVI